ncbi:MAG: translation elongation factor Ts [Victivallaceae bacterium]|nr:translation elongation factor Ts [Victivallaceae bacterium]MDD3703430.1 translation elongation factor Ts [Victivallaceae bacterium]MDD4318699.1 translation elongation factor Ts [Victivallaceae bacterium]MDD5664426.1 translation elongation factor Ts [Victivallaceae bacterium]NLK83159.1 elongation factor Ts [Lentisphaerota bacterium]
MNITAEMVKNLRDKTGAGMMECKRALEGANGDPELAIDNLRKSGVLKAEKKASRATKEGKVMAVISGDSAAMVEILCETDFVSKTDKFQDFVKSVAEKAAGIDCNGCVSEKLNEQEKDSLTGMIAVIGENMQIRRAVSWKLSGKVASYLHGGGRIGVMAEVEGLDDENALNDLCMHIAAFNPAYICEKCISEDTVKHEREIAAAQLTGKPANIIEKIIDGKINKWLSEVCLVNQPWIRDDKTSFKKLFPNAKITRFVRWEVGEELA